MSEAVVGLFGVIVGGLITGVVSYVTLRQTIAAQLRLTAADRRLQAHQEAFALWRKILSNVHSEDIGQVVMECQEWWENNCLYLDAQARGVFLEAIHSASHHASFKADRKNAELMMENWERIMRAGEVIVASVNLPSLGEKEKKLLQTAGE